MKSNATKKNKLHKTWKIKCRDKKAQRSNWWHIKEFKRFNYMIKMYIKAKVSIYNVWEKKRQRQEETHEERNYYIKF